MARRPILLRDDSGQTVVEYATVVALVAIVLALALAVVPGNPFGAFWSVVTSALS
jgi:Flp pilus assembly pilin Flp